MTEERIREIARAFGGCAEVDAIADAIRQALAERDREIAEWAKASGYTSDTGHDYVWLDDLVAYLEAGGNAT